jgi:hypothetical protein
VITLSGFNCTTVTVPRDVRLDAHKRGAPHVPRKTIVKFIGNKNAKKQIQKNLLKNLKDPSYQYPHNYKHNTPCLCLIMC